MEPVEGFTPEERDLFIRILQRISEDPSVIAGDERMKGLIAKIHRRGRKGERLANRSLQQQQDGELRRHTATVRRDLESRPLAEADATAAALTVGALHRPASCYICKQRYTELHFFYHSLCPPCASRNYARRTQRADLSGRTVLLTGGRIKIGYQLALKLLRDGARVILTTRFPADALRRLASEGDFTEWRHRVEIVGLDLRNLPAVEAFAHRLLETEPHLDILINNAAQTIKRPLAFYRHLLDREESPALLEALPGYPAEPFSRFSTAPVLPVNGAEHGEMHSGRETVEITPTPMLPPPTARGDGACVSGLLPDHLFSPPGECDPDGQQVDRRPQNSWALRQHEVTTLELLEVHLVNAVAPFILCRELRPLFLRSPFSRRFIINVSAMEGQFARQSKTEHHPHTNMAKAALNMLTRTAAADFARDGISMNSVDTGWITDEKPFDRRRQHQEEGFFTPLDAVDGAARVYDPVVRGLTEADEPLWGQFLKDYAPHPW